MSSKARRPLIYIEIQDFEIATKYQNIVHVAFRDPQSAHNIPAGFDVLKVPAPRIAFDRPGGIGLDDLEGLLKPQERAQEVGIPAFDNVMENVLESERDEKKVMECRIQRSRM